MKHFIVGLIFLLTGTFSFASNMNVKIKAKGHFIELFQNFNSQPEFRKQFQYLKSAEVKPFYFTNAEGGEFVYDGWQMIFRDKNLECSLTVFVSKPENFDPNNFNFSGSSVTKHSVDSDGKISDSMEIRLRPEGSGLLSFLGNQNFSPLRRHTIKCEEPVVTPEILISLLSEVFEVSAHDLTSKKSPKNDTGLDIKGMYEGIKNWF